MPTLKHAGFGVGDGLQLDECADGLWNKSEQWNDVQTIDNGSHSDRGKALPSIGIASTNFDALEIGCKHVKNDEAKDYGLMLQPSN